MSIRRARFAFVCVLFLCLPALAQNNPAPDKAAELADWIKANYTKYEYRIPVRDGVHLFTAVYVPKDASDTQTYPIMLNRTPYSVAPYGEDDYPRTLGPSELFARAKYIFVLQDVRGSFMSEGEYVNMRPEDAAERGGNAVDESTDTYDTIDWLVKNVPHNNGRVGIWGISYPGFYAAAATINAHPALKAASPQAPIADWFLGDDFHHNGALYLPHFFNFISVFGLPRTGPTSKWGNREFEFGTPDGYDFFLNAEPLPRLNEKYLHHHVGFWDEVVQHPNYDAFWRARNLPQHLKNTRPATMVVGGWFDAEDLYGALHTFGAIDKNNPAAPDTLVMGPWFHGGWARGNGEKLGNVVFNARTSEYYRQNIELPFFEYHLKGRGNPKLPKAYVFETGSNQWRTYDAWPPKQAKKTSLFLCAGGVLSFGPCAAQGGSGGIATAGSRDYDEYVSDPTKPVPFIVDIAIGMTREHMTADQRLAGRRTDVLVYQTAPLEQDITLAGPLVPSLQVSTTGTDSDFVVKLIDAYPNDIGPTEPDTRNPKTAANEVPLNGYQQLVRGEAMRGRYRNSFENPQPFEPGKVTKIEYVMPDVNHTFRRGHRIMVQVQSSWFPLVDLNPQKFVDIYTASPADFQKATERVYHSVDAASRVDVVVLGK